MPFVRDRSKSPGIVDRRRQRRETAATVAIVELQLRMGLEQQFNERMKPKFWESNHGQSMTPDNWTLRFFVWAEPTTFVDRSMRDGLVATCVVRRGEEVFRSGQIDCDLDRGFVQVFPADFAPAIANDDLAGIYDVEWIISDSQLASRDKFTLDATGTPV